MFLAKQHTDPRPSTPPHTHSVMYGPIVGTNHSPLGGNCQVDGGKIRACARLLQAGFKPGPTRQLQLGAASCIITTRSGTAGSHVSQQKCVSRFDRKV
jgi:hypothetical protein